MTTMMTGGQLVAGESQSLPGPEEGQAVAPKPDSWPGRPSLFRMLAVHKVGWVLAVGRECSIMGSMPAAGAGMGKALGAEPGMARLSCRR